MGVTTPTTPRSAASALVETLIEADVGTVFGLPGVHNLPIWEALDGSPIRLVGVRHEQAAVYAADGVYRVSQELGVAITTTGPGAANALGAVGESWSAGSAVLVIATDIATSLRRPGTYRGVLHECEDQEAMFAPVTKATFRAATADEVPIVAAEAVATALTAPSGPVYLELPTDVLVAETAVGTGSIRPGEVAAADSELTAQAAEILATAESPLIWAGGGALRAGAGVELMELARRIGAPVIETYMARGLVESGHPCRVGIAPHFPEVGQLWDEADVVLAVGSDFDGMMTQNWQMPQPRCLISINVKAKDCVKNYVSDLALVGDASRVCGQLLDSLPKANGTRLEPLADRLADIRGRVRSRISAEEPQAGRLLEILEESLPEDANLVVDMCIPGYWVAAAMEIAPPRRLSYPVGWGTLGSAFPTALGTALADSGRTVVVCGDGGFLFAVGELATVKQEDIPMTVVIVDDGGYGMLRYDQAIAGHPRIGTDLESPDFVALAASFGLPTAFARGIDELPAALSEAESKPGPFVVICNAAMSPPETTSPRWPRR